MKTTFLIILLSVSVQAFGQPKALNTSESPAEPRTFTVNEVGVSIQLPRTWSNIDQERLEAMNKVVREITPQYKFTFVAGIQKDSSVDKPDGFPTYILVQKTPGKRTAKQLLALYPSIRRKTEADVNEAVKALGFHVASGETYMDEKLKMVVLLISGGSENGKFVGRCYQIPTKENLVGINVYCRPEAAKAVFIEVEKSLLTLQIAESSKMPDNWFEELKSYLKL